MTNMTGTCQTNLIKKVVQRLFMLIETVNQTSNYTQISSEVGELLRLSAVHTVHLLFWTLTWTQNTEPLGSLAWDLFPTLTPRCRKIWNQPMLVACSKIILCFRGKSEKRKKKQTKTTLSSLFFQMALIFYLLR